MDEGDTVGSRKACTDCLWGRLYKPYIRVGHVYSSPLFLNQSHPCDNRIAGSQARPNDYLTRIKTKAID